MEDNKANEMLNDVPAEQASADRIGKVIKYASIWLAIVAAFLVINVGVKMLNAASTPDGYRGVYYPAGQPAANNYNGPLGGGGCGGSGNCCSSGSGGQADGAGYSDFKELEKAAVKWYAENFGDANVTAEVLDFGCHQEINIKKDGRVVKELSLINGQFQAINSSPTY